MSDDMTPAMEAALATSGVTVFVAGEVNFPGYDLRLLDGAGKVTWAQGTFIGRDDTFGQIASVDAINDGFGDQAPMLSFSLNPPSETAAADLLNPAIQGSRVRIWLGAMLTPKVVVSDPYLLFDGFVDQPALNVGRGTREITYECVSQFERFFRDEEGARLSQSNQQRFFSTDTFLNDVTGIVKNVHWGPGDPIGGSPVAYGYSGGFGGGSGRGGGYRGFGLTPMNAR